MPIERNGRLEDVWWTYGYSRVRNDEGDINGVLVVVQETTQRVLLEQRLRDSQARLVELFVTRRPSSAWCAGPTTYSS